MEKNISEKVSCLITVSYTHLDVYKRQGVWTKVESLSVNQNLSLIHI